MQAALPRLLLACGVLASAVYIGMDLVSAAWLYPGYDITAQQVSELSAIGAPSRAFWMQLSVPYSLLTVLFALGVWQQGRGHAGLRTVAVLILLFAVNGYAWGIVAPMHMRGTQFTDTDTMHIAFAISAILIMLAFMTVGAMALGRGFRLFTAVLAAAMLAAGAVVSTQLAEIAAGRPTPWMGLVERISVYAPMLWLAGLAVVLLRAPRPVSGSARPAIGVRA